MRAFGDAKEFQEIFKRNFFVFDGILCVCVFVC